LVRAGLETLNAPWLRQVAAEKSADRSAHSKELSKATSVEAAVRMREPLICAVGLAIPDAKNVIIAAWSAIISVRDTVIALRDAIISV
jgi:hypothetical protein